jgi:hypothetical protein
MLTKSLFTTAALMLSSTSFAQAQPPPGQPTYGGQMQMQMGHQASPVHGGFHHGPGTPKVSRELHDDRRDLDRLNQMLVRMDRARAMNDVRTLRQLDTELSAFIRKEWNESRRELYMARREEQDSKMDLRDGASRRERRDYWQDRRNTQEEKRFQRDLTNISNRLQPLYGRMDRRSVDMKRSLLGQLITLAEREMQRTLRELREDRRDAVGHRPMR